MPLMGLEHLLSSLFTFWSEDPDFSFLCSIDLLMTSSWLLPKWRRGGDGGAGGGSRERNEREDKQEATMPFMAPPPQKGNLVPFLEGSSIKECVGISKPQQKGHVWEANSREGIRTQYVEDICRNTLDQESWIDLFVVKLMHHPKR